MSSIRMSLDEVYQELKEANITDQEQRKFIIDSRDMLPAHEIVVLISYVQRGWNIEQIKQQIVPIMEHIDKKEPKTTQIER